MFFSLQLRMPIYFEDNVKNPLVFPSRCEKSTSFLNVDRIIHLLFPAAARSLLGRRHRPLNLLLSAIVKITLRNNVLLRKLPEMKIEKNTAEETLFGKNRFLFHRRN